MNNISITDTISVKVNTDFNLRNRLNELPHAAWSRINHKTLGLHKPRYHNILNGDIKRIFKVEIEAFCRKLKCSEEDLFNPNYIFKDFRTEEEKLNDLMGIE